MEETNAMLDAAEAEMAAGYGIPDEEVWRELEEELAEIEAKEEDEQHIISHTKDYQLETI